MFRKREMTVKFNKVKDKEDVEPKKEIPLEEKAEAILKIAERVAIKVFAGVCVYIVLDTGRRVAIERSKINHED